MCSYKIDQNFSVQYTVIVLIEFCYFYIAYAINLLIYDFNIESKKHD